MANPTWETDRSIQSRLKEKIVDTNHSPISKSSIGKHSLKSKHHIYFDQTKVLEHTSHYNS